MLSRPTLADPVLIGGAVPIGVAPPFCRAPYRFGERAGRALAHSKLVRPYPASFGQSHVSDPAHLEEHAEGGGRQPHEQPEERFIDDRPGRTPEVFTVNSVEDQERGGDRRGRTRNRGVDQDDVDRRKFSRIAATVKSAPTITATRATIQSVSTPKMAMRPEPNRAPFDATVMRTPAYQNRWETRGRRGCR